VRMGSRQPLRDRQALFVKVQSFVVAREYAQYAAYACVSLGKVALPFVVARICRRNFLEEIETTTKRVERFAVTTYIEERIRRFCVANCQLQQIVCHFACSTSALLFAASLSRMDKLF